MIKKHVNIGMIGYKFMGKAHSHAYKDVCSVENLQVHEFQYISPFRVNPYRAGVRGENFIVPGRRPGLYMMPFRVNPSG